MIEHKQEILIHSIDIVHSYLTECNISSQGVHLRSGESPEFARYSSEKRVIQKSLSSSRRNYLSSVGDGVRGYCCGEGVSEVVQAVGECVCAWG